MTTPVRERKLDDAHGTVPLVLGAFTSRERGSCLGRPLASFYLPAVNLRTGKWTLHASESIQFLQAGLNAWEFRMKQALDVNESTCALAKVLEAFDKVEARCVEVLQHTAADDAATTVVVRNLIAYKKVLYNGHLIRNALKSDEEKNGWKDTFRAENESRCAILKKLPFQNTHGIVAFDEFEEVNAFIRTMQCTPAHVKEYCDNATLQEKHACDNIVAILNAIRKYYENIKTRICAAGFKSSMETEILKARPADKTETWAELQIDQVLDNFLVERIELFYCCVHTTFVLLNGHHKATFDALNKFIKHAIAACTAPLFFKCMSKPPEDTFKTGIDPAAEPKMKRAFQAYKAQEGFDMYMKAVLSDPTALSADEISKLQPDDICTKVDWMFSSQLDKRSLAIELFEKTHQAFHVRLPNKHAASTLGAYIFDDGRSLRDSVTKHLRGSNDTDASWASNIVFAALDTDPIFASLFAYKALTDSLTSRVNAIAYLRSKKSPFINKASGSDPSPQEPSAVPTVANPIAVTPTLLHLTLAKIKTQTALTSSPKPKAKKSKPPPTKANPPQDKSKQPTSQGTGRQGKQKKGNPQ